MPSSTQALPLIRPITDMRTKFNEVCAQASEEQEPIILTKNGLASYVFLDKDAYEAEKQRDRIRMALREAEIEERYRPATVSAEASDTRMEKIFAALGVGYART